MIAPPAVEMPAASPSVPAAPSAPSGPSQPRTAAAPAAPRTTAPAAWLPLLASLPLPLVIVLVAVVGERPLLIVMLGLTLLSGLLLAGALVPARLLTRVHVSETAFARYRQPLALSAVGILAPVTAAAVLTALI